MSLIAATLGKIAAPERRTMDHWRKNLPREVERAVAVVKAGGATPQAFDSEGAAMPMVPRSNPSNACTRAQMPTKPTPLKKNVKAGWPASSSLSVFRSGVA